MKKKCILSMILSVFLIGTATVPCFAGTVEDLENKISDSQNNLQNLQSTMLCGNRGGSGKQNLRQSE